MLGKIDTALTELKTGAKAIEDPAEVEEAEAFLEWIADNHFTMLGYGCYDLVRDRRGDQLRRVEGSALGILTAPEERGGDLAQFRCAAAGGAPSGKGTGAPRDHQGEYAGHGAPSGLSRLYRRQALRCRPQGDWRAPILRPVHLGRLQSQPALDPAAAAQGRPASGAGQSGIDQPCRQGARQHPRNLPARRALPDRRRRAVGDRPGDPASPPTPTDPAVPAARRVRPVRILHGLRATRSATTPSSGASTRRFCKRHSAAPRSNTRPKYRNPCSRAFSSSCARPTAFPKGSRPATSRPA